MYIFTKRVGVRPDLPILAPAIMINAHHPHRDRVPYARSWVIFLTKILCACVCGPEPRQSMCGRGVVRAMSDPRPKSARNPAKKKEPRKSMKPGNTNHRGTAHIQEAPMDDPEPCFNGGSIFDRKPAGSSKACMFSTGTILVSFLPPLNRDVWF